ncbi:MAG: 2-oxoacid:acceptor oxidoreductase family protein [Fibrobacterota bacterium]
MKELRIQIGGRGGQGILLLGNILGRAAALYGNRHASLTEAYGPEARGGFSAARLVLSDSPVIDPFTGPTDIFIVLAQMAYDRLADGLSPQGLVLYAKDRVRPRKLPVGVRSVAVDSSVLAEQAGVRQAENMVMAGFFTGFTAALKSGWVQRAIRECVPEKSVQANLAAFELGRKAGLRNT